MKLKQRPDDFTVEEISRFTADAAGSHHVFRLWKRGLSTLDVMGIIAKRYGVPLYSQHMAGLKDKHAETTQLISLPRPMPTTNHDPRWSLTYLGRSAQPISGENLIGNRFRIVVRDLSATRCERAPETLANIVADGVPNFFDAQRFGSARHGQGFAVERLIAGDFEAAVRLFLTARNSHDAKQVRHRKAHIENHWGRWERLAHDIARGDEVPVVRHLAQFPDDWPGAFAAIDRHLRHLLLTAFQSFVWNLAVNEFLAAHAARQFAGYFGIAPMFFFDELGDWFADFAGAELPLPAATAEISHPKWRAAMDAAMASRELSLPSFRIEVREELADKLAFKPVMRPVVLRPTSASWEPLGADESNPGRFAGRLSFELPSGSYATLIAKRLFETVAGPDSPHFVPGARPWHTDD